MENKGMLNIINRLSRLDESTARTRHYQCSRCHAISEGYKLPEGVDEVCPLCDTELTVDDKYYEAELSTTPVRECGDLELEEQEELQDTIDELEETRGEYIELVSESRFYKARKLLEDTDTVIIVDSEGITDEGDVEEDAISIQKDVELPSGEEIRLQVESSDLDKDQEGKKEEIVDEVEELEESLRRARTRSRMRRMRESVGDNQNIVDAITSTFIDYTFDISDITTTATSDGVAVDLIVKATKESADAYLDDIVQEIASKTNMLVDYIIVSTESDLIGLALTFKSQLTEEAELNAAIEDSKKLIDEIKDEIEDGVEEVIESHRRKFRNAVLKESDDTDLNNEEELVEDGEDLEEDLEDVVEKVFRKLRSKLVEYRVDKSDFEKAKDAIIAEVEELSESATKKRIAKRNRLVESTIEYPISDVLDADEDILEDLEDEVVEAVEDALDDMLEEDDDEEVIEDEVIEESKIRGRRRSFRR